MSVFRRFFLFIFIAPALAQDDIPYGLEFVAGIRASYHQRGVELAEDLIDLQLQSNIIIADETSLNLALWQGAEISGDFREFGALVGIEKHFDEFTLSGELSYYNYESSVVSSGVDLAITGDYSLSDNLSAFGVIGYSDGAESIYAQLGLFGSQKISGDSFVDVKVQLNAADSYFGREGIYDLTTRASFTYNINSLLSATPFLSVSIPLDDAGADLDISIGTWFEVFF